MKRSGVDEMEVQAVLSFRDRISPARPSDEDPIFEEAVTKILALSKRALGESAAPAEHMRYVTQLFAIGPRGESEDKTIRLLRGCYGRLFQR